MKSSYLKHIRCGASRHPGGKIRLYSLIALLFAATSVKLFAEGDNSLFDKWKLQLTALPGAGEMFFSHELIVPGKTNAHVSTLAYYWVRWDGEDYIIKQFANPAGTNTPETFAAEHIFVHYDNKFETYYSDVRSQFQPKNPSDSNIVRLEIEGAWETSCRMITFGLESHIGKTIWDGRSFVINIGENQVCNGRVISQLPNSLPIEVHATFKENPQLEFKFEYAYEVNDGKFYPCAISTSINFKNLSEHVEQSAIYYLNPLPTNPEAFLASLQRVVPSDNRRTFVYVGQSVFAKHGTNLDKVRPANFSLVSRPEIINATRWLMFLLFVGPLVGLLLWQFRRCGSNKNTKEREQ